MAQLKVPTSAMLSRLLDQQVQAWQNGAPIRVEQLLQQEPSLADSCDAVLDLIYGEVVLREERGQAPRVEEYVQRFPHLEEGLRRQFAVHEMLGDEVQDSRDILTRPGVEDTLPEKWASDRPLSQLGDYDLFGEVGRGGMGVVYRGRHRRLSSRWAAVKALRPDGADDALARFRAEANAVAQLQHPHIVPIYELGNAVDAETGKITHFVALEWVEGGNLAQRLAGAPITGVRAAELLLPLAEAMGYAHRQGILHRDLKPSNILLTAGETPKIADFGLAKRLDIDDGNTRTGAILGTPSYMAPEQAAGKNATLTPAVDVYALGAILYEMLTGRPPFRGETVFDTIQQVQAMEPIAPSKLQPRTPRDLETICLQCLQKDPARRYATAQALADDLRRFLQHEPIHARRAGLVERSWSWARRRPAAASLALVSLAALIGLTTLWAYFTVELRHERDEARKQTTIAQDQKEEARKQSERALQILEYTRISVDSVAMTVRAVSDQAKKTGVNSVLFQLACSYAKTSSALANDLSFSDKDRLALSEQFAVSAVKLLGCAKSQGYFDSTENRAALGANHDLAWVKNRGDFKQLFATVSP